MEASPIYLSPPDVGQLESQLVLQALESGWVSPKGSFLDDFERLLANLSQRKHAVALSSGTSALHLGLLALGIGRGDLVVCSSLTFVATANAIRYVGATPVFIDSDPVTGNMSISLLKEAVQTLSLEGKRISAAIPVDFLGCMADHPEILDFCEYHQIPVLVDSAESLGASYQGRPSGSFGQLAVFSFNGNKIATTSGGGAVVTDDHHLAERVRFLASQAREPTPHYEHKELGYNYRLSNISAAIGVGQLRRLDDMVSVRRANRARYREIFAAEEGVSFLGREDHEDNCWLTAVMFHPEECRISRGKLDRVLSEAGIESRALWKPMHLQPLYRSEVAFVNGTAESIFNFGIALPSGSGLSDNDWERIERAIGLLTKSGKAD